MKYVFKKSQETDSWPSICNIEKRKKEKKYDRIFM